MSKSSIQQEILDNQQKIQDWEQENHIEPIYEITPDKIGAILPSNNRLIETSTLVMQFIVSLLLLTFFSIGVYIVFGISDNDNIPSPVGWTLMFISFTFLIGINYGYIVRYIEDYRRMKRVIRYYFRDDILTEVQSLNAELEITNWRSSEILEFEINNLHETNLKLDRVASIVISQGNKQPLKIKLFRVPTSKVEIATEFIATAKVKLN
jgi:hypothetical protein